MVSALVHGSKRSGFETWGLLLEGPRRKVFAPGKLWHNLKPYYDYRAVLFTYSYYNQKFPSYIQEFSGVYTALFLDTDLFKMGLPARKACGAFEN